MSDHNTLADVGQQFRVAARGGAEAMSDHNPVRELISMQGPSAVLDGLLDEEVLKDLLRAAAQVPRRNLALIRRIVDEELAAAEERILQRVVGLP